MVDSPPFPCHYIFMKSKGTSLFAALICLCQALLAGSPIPESDGILLPRNRVSLSIPVEARLREVRVQEGQTVKKGDVLAILYSEAEELDEKRAAAQLKRATFIYNSKVRLNETRTVSEVEMLGAEVDMEVAKIELDRAKAVLRDKSLTAPWDGQVLRLARNEGETVNRAEKVIELIDYSKIWVDVYLDAKYLTMVKAGQKARVAGDAVGSDPATAIVAMVDPVVEPGSGLSRIRLEMGNADLRIPTGLPVKVQFEQIGVATNR